MFRPADIQIDSFLDHLRATYTDIYGAGPTDHCDTVVAVGRMTLSRIARSDALFFDVEHAINTTMVGIEMLYGRLARSGFFASRDWLHVICALLCAHVGMVRGALSGDRESDFVVDISGKTITLPVGATDSALWVHAAKRSAIFVQQNYQGHRVIDPDALAATIEQANMLAATPGANVGSSRAIVRAALVVAILADPNFEKKLVPLFLTAKEAGVAEFLGFETIEAVRAGLSGYFWNTLHTDIGEGIQLLDQSGPGRTLLANMYARLLASEHGMAEVDAG